MSIKKSEYDEGSVDEKATLKDPDDLKNAYDVNELKDIINELNQDLNKDKNEESNKTNSMNVLNKNDDLSKNADDKLTKNIDNVNQQKLSNFKEKNIEESRKESNQNLSLTKKEESDLISDLESYLSKSGTESHEQIDDQTSSINSIQQQSSISSDQDDKDNDFELISSNDQLDFEDSMNSMNLNSNLDSNISSTSDKTAHTNQSDHLPAATTSAKMSTLTKSNEKKNQENQSFKSENLVKRNSQNNLKDNFKSKENKLKLFHHKSAELIDQKKQTWQKQLLQTQFFKSFNTQQILSHYNNNLQNLELPDKIVNQDDSDPDEPLLSGSGEVTKECSDELIQSWSAILSKWKKPNQRPAGLKDLIKFGIPETLRGQVWQLLVEGDNDMEIIDNYRVLITKESEFEINIERDINRTFPANDYFNGKNSLGQDNLFKLCKAYSIFDEEIGYVQGLTFIGAALLLHMPEEQAFVVLVRIMHDYGVRNLFRSSFENLHLRFYQLDRLIEEQLPELYQHFNKIGIETHMYSSNWILTLFTSKFPLHLVYYILDLFLTNKFNTIFQVSIALLSLSSSDLLKLDFEETLKYFRVYLPKKYKTDANAKYLLKTAINVKLKKLDKYERDYAQFKESKKDPVQRLIEENRRLQNSVFRLERESDLLANELSNSKLAMRHQLDLSEDKVDHLASELSRRNKYLSELEEEKKLLEVEANNLKEICRRELETVETRADQREKISQQYKEICSKLSARLEEQEKINKELKENISACSQCSQFIVDDKDGDNSSSSGSFMDGLRKNSSDDNDEIKRLEKRIHDLEIELAQTKLELVETKCTNQALHHKLSLK